MSQEELIREAVESFLGFVPYVVKPTLGGVNNHVFYIDVESSQKERYVLRIYNNGNNTLKVRFEHAVLSELNKLPLNFKVPEALTTLTTNEKIISLSNGMEASMFYEIPGWLPKLTLVKEIGQASGQLSKALSEIKVDLSPATPAYYDLYKAHHIITRDLFFDRLNKSDLDFLRETVNEIIHYILDLEKLIEKLHQLSLPHQLIHGDLHYDNILVQDNEVMGLLDFEFCAWDWRGMELAICLSKYASESDPMEYFSTLIEGYMEFVHFTDKEIEVLPDLIILRILNNVVFFVGRSIANEDNIETLTSRLKTYVYRIKWINANRLNIVNIIRESNSLEVKIV